jgi:hypothetical protein
LEFLEWGYIKGGIASSSAVRGIVISNEPWAKDETANEVPYPGDIGGRRLPDGVESILGRIRDDRPKE